MINSGDVLLKIPNDISGARKIDAEFQNAVELIRQAQILRSKGSIAAGLKELERALNTPELNQEFEDQVLLELQNKKQESMASLLKWEKVATEGLELHQGKMLYEMPLI